MSEKQKFLIRLCAFYFLAVFIAVIIICVLLDAYGHLFLSISFSSLDQIGFIAILVFVLSVLLTSLHA